MVSGGLMGMKKGVRETQDISREVMDERGRQRKMKDGGGG